MCGRTAQTFNAVRAAATSLQSGSGSFGISIDLSGLPGNAPSSDDAEIPRDNFNMSPGMDAFVFWKGEDGHIQVDRKVWGLIPKRGTPASPIPDGMGKHFDNLMFNARSDTLFAKPTFARLLKSGRSCLIAVDGFFEWKAEIKGRKQPYYIYRKGGDAQVQQRPYLLLAGLWTSVPTGLVDSPTLDTFTILTTEACRALEWLHSRMPVAIWNEKLALEWLVYPSADVHRRLDEAARQSDENMLHWHAVTTDMTSMKFRTMDAIKALPKMKTVKSFFSAAKAGTKVGNSLSSRESTYNAPTSSRVEVTSLPTQKRAVPENDTRTMMSTPAMKKSKKIQNSSPQQIDSYFKAKSQTK